MKNSNFLKQTILAAVMVFVLPVMAVFGQCEITITDDQSYFEDFEGSNFECWMVESTGSAKWERLVGSQSTVAAFSSDANDYGSESRLVSPVFDMSAVDAVTFSFSYSMMGLYEMDELVISYRTSEEDPWHDLGSFSFSDWSGFYEEMYTLDNLSSTVQVSFLGRAYGGYYIFIDNIEIKSIEGCARPIALEATEITPFSALLSWSSNGNEQGWILETNGIEKPITDMPFLFEGLLPQQTYTFRVKALCGEDSESEWSTLASFTTLCDVILVTDDEPYYDDFESSEDFVCWQNEIISGDDDWVVDPGYVNPNNTAFFIWLGGEAMLFSAPLDISTVTNPTLTFNHRQPQGQYSVDEIQVFYRTSETDVWHILEIYDTPTNGWETVTIDLPNPSATYQIGFLGIAHNANGVYVDEVRVGKSMETGIAEDSPVVAVVAPNPTKGMALLETGFADGEVVVFDLFGKQVTTAKVKEGRAEIDLSGCASGVYTARVTSATHTATVKLMKD